MALTTFAWPYHNVQHTRNNPAPTVQFNGGWLFSAKPTSPEIRIFTLSFSGMAYYVNTGGVVDATINADKNMAALDAFYVARGCWDSFLYTHPVLGTLTVRFHKPLDVPKLRRDGVVEDFTVELVEMLQ